MKLVKVCRYSVLLWIIVLLFSAINIGIVTSYPESISGIPLEVKESLEILNYPLGFSLYPGETAEFSLTVQNHASVNYSVRLDCQLNDTTYQAKYVTFTNEIYTVMPGKQTLDAWLKVSFTAPPANVLISITLITVDEQANELPPSVSGLPPSIELLGGGARWAAGDGTSALYINWKDNWVAHHLTDGVTWGPWPSESEMDNWRFWVAYALEQSGFNVDFAGDIPESLSGYDLVVIYAYWAVEPRHNSLIRDYISNGGGVVILSGVPCLFTVYCKDWWPLRASGAEFDGVRFGLGPIQEWFGARYYVNTGGYLHLDFGNPFDTSLSADHKVSMGDGHSFAAVTSLSSDTGIVAHWDYGPGISSWVPGTVQDPIFAFTYEFGQGRVYYQAAIENVDAVTLEDHELVVTSSPITEITFLINGDPNVTPHTFTLSEGSYTLEMPETHDGYVWSHWLEDGDTNSTKTVTVDTQIMLTAVFVPETAPLTLSILSPENKTYSVTDVLLDFTASESVSWIGHSLDNQANVTITENTTITGLSDGIHNLLVYANDTAGNMAMSGTVWFTVDATPPNITDVTQVPVENNVTSEDAIKVNATVTDAVSGVEWVALNYTNSNGAWMITEMTNLEENKWNATIPAFPHGTNITYTIIAKDRANNTITTEELLGYPYQYEVFPEFSPFLLLPIFLIGTLLPVIIYRKRLKRGTDNL